MASLIACGGEEPPPQAPTAPPPEPQTKPGLRVRSELGSVDPGAVKQTFHELEGKFTKCQAQGIGRIEVLSGHVKFFVRIGEEGVAKWAYLEESELGDRATEKCLIAAAIDVRWPKPDAGEAEARYSMDLPLEATRPPSEWNSDKVTGALAKSRSAIEACKAGSGSFRATLYVGPGGRVLAAGVATPAKEDETKADCLAGVLVKVHGLASPGSWPAKVSFEL